MNTRLSDRLKRLEAQAGATAAARREVDKDATTLASHMTVLADRLPPEEAADARSFRDTLLRSNDAFLIKVFACCEPGDWQL